MTSCGYGGCKWDLGYEYEPVHQGYRGREWCRFRTPRKVVEVGHRLVDHILVDLCRRYLVASEVIMFAFYVLLLKWPDDAAIYTTEGPVMNTTADVIAAIRQLPSCVDVKAVIRVPATGTQEDVTEAVANEVYDLWRNDGYDPVNDQLPDFCRQHMSAKLDSGYRGPEREDDDDKQAAMGVWA